VQNTYSSTEDSFISTAGNYGFVLSLYFCKSLHSKIDTKRKAKNPIKAHGWNHHTEDKREGQRKAKRCAAIKNQRREIPDKPLRTGYPPS